MVFPQQPKARWKEVTTWGGPTLYEQGLGDWKGYQWFRTTIDTPDDIKNIMLWFGGNDGKTRIWVNGKPVPVPMYKVDKKTKQTPMTWQAEHTRYCDPGWTEYTDALPSPDRRQNVEQSACWQKMRVVQSAGRAGWSGLVAGHSDANRSSTARTRCFGNDSTIWLSYTRAMGTGACMQCVDERASE
jgi:hypothetical protein